MGTRCVEQRCLATRTVTAIAPGRPTASAAAAFTATAAATASAARTATRRGLTLDVTFRLRQESFTREAHAPVAVDLDDLHVDLVAEAHVVLDRLDARPVHPRDVHQPVLTGRE